jgi:cobalamin-dependent methionine synthase I
MGIQGLKIIGETINDSIPKTGRLFEKGDLGGILELAKFQERMGANYLDLNIGQREPDHLERPLGHLCGL